MDVRDLTAPLFIAWQINSECNLGCLHCCEEAGHTFYDEMNKQEVFNFLEQIASLKIPYVALSGGEPLLHPYFFEICEFIRGHDISLKIETNGEFIDEEKAGRLAGLKLRSVQISLDGATSLTHERLRIKGDWHKAVAACKLLLKEGVNTEIVFVPTQFNIQEIGELIDLAYSLGVYGVYTGKIMRIGRAARNWHLLCPSPEQYEKFFEVLKEKAVQYDPVGNQRSSNGMKVYFYPYDVVEELKYRLENPSASLLVLPNGKVKLIGPLPFICGDLKRHSLKDVWERYKEAWHNPEVISFSQRVIENQELLVESNNWREL